jgi:hypothetical protein
VDQVHESVDRASSVHRGPRGHCRARELTGARPQGAPVPKSSDRGAGERKGGLANSMAGLPRLGRRWKDVSLATEASAQKGDDEGSVRAKGGSVGGVGGFTEGGVGFYRAEARGEGRVLSIAGLKERQWRVEGTVSGIEEGGMAPINGGG